MTTHPITEPMRQITLQAMRQRNVTKAQIAEAVGSGKAWVTKLLDGTLKTIKESHMHALEDLLGIQYLKIEQATGDRSPLANKMAAIIDTDPTFAKLVVAFENALTEARGAFTPRFIPTKDMAKIGNEIIRICYANEDKPGKVAREVLKLLA